MKLTILILLTSIFLIQYAESRELTWVPNIFNTFANKTAQITSFLREKGKTLRNYYHEKFKKKISTVWNSEHLKTGPEVRSVDQYDDNRQSPEILNEVYDVDTTRLLPIRRRHAATTRKPKRVINKIKAKPCNNEDPTISMTTPQLIAYHGYPSESHTIVTDDGYILTLHRIPYAKKSDVREAPRKTVLLHHGLLGSSADWVISGPNKALSYILSEAGYDVWLANVRGNTYSRAHKKWNINSFNFWNFTFHEVAQHDLPAIIDYIMEIKGWDTKINYVGHSMGTTVLFAMLSTKLKYNQILRAGFALAPVAYMSEIKSPIRLLAKFSNNIDYLFKLLGANEFLPQNSVIRWLSKHACEINHYEEAICENSLFMFCGFDERQFDRSLLPLILGHVPAGASTKTLIHYAQEIKSGGRFQYFDYGPEVNLEVYQSLDPPEYPVHKITLPIALLSSENDWLSSDIDVTNLYVQLANPIEHFIVPLKTFNHIDFLWAKDAPKLVYLKLLHLMEEGVQDFDPKPEDISKVIDVTMLENEIET